MYQNVMRRDEMSGNEIYGDIAKRTNGQIYIGVVGPVRSGKSTFIKRFMETPEVVKQAGGCGVRLKVCAHTTHLIGVDVLTEINPVVGTEQQSGDLVKYLSGEFDSSPENLWNTNLFGKTLKKLADEGLRAKTERMSDKTKEKFAETLGRMINEGSSGMICIIL